MRYGSRKVLRRNSNSAIEQYYTCSKAISVIKIAPKTAMGKDSMGRDYETIRIL